MDRMGSRTALVQKLWGPRNLFSRFPTVVPGSKALIRFSAVSKDLSTTSLEERWGFRAVVRPVYRADLQPSLSSVMAQVSNGMKLGVGGKGGGSHEYMIPLPGWCGVHTGGGKAGDVALAKVGRPDSGVMGQAGWGSGVGRSLA